MYECRYDIVENIYEHYVPKLNQCNPVECKRRENANNRQS